MKGKPVQEVMKGDWRGILASILMVRCNFCYGGLIWWLGGEYTNEDCDWEQCFAWAKQVADIPPLANYSMNDLPWAIWAMTEGIPLAGKFDCSFQDLVQHSLQNNNNAFIYQAEAAVWQQLQKKNGKSFHILLLHFTWCFMYGLHLCFMSFVMRKGKERTIIDPSTKLQQMTWGQWIATPLLQQ